MFTRNNSFGILLTKVAGQFSSSGLGEALKRVPWHSSNMSDYVFVCVNFSTPTNSSLMPEACPRIQLNSNTIYWKVKLYSTSKGLIPHLHPLLQTPITSSVHYLYFWLTSCKSELPTTLSLRLMNLPELFRELRKIHYLLYYWFILKEY